MEFGNFAGALGWRHSWQFVRDFGWSISGTPWWCYTGHLKLQPPQITAPWTHGCLNLSLPKSWPSKIAASPNCSLLHWQPPELESPQIMAFWTCSLSKLQPLELAPSLIWASQNHSLLNLQPPEFKPPQIVALRTLSLPKSWPPKLKAPEIQVSPNCSLLN